MNSTLKSLLFWMVLIVVGVLIWQFSTGFQRSETRCTFSQFLKHVDNGRSREVTMTGNEITGSLNNSVSGDGSQKFRTYAPTPVRRVWPTSSKSKNVQITAKPETTSPGRRCSIRGRRFC